jgi:hypothetical protein
MQNRSWPTDSIVGQAAPYPVAARSFFPVLLFAESALRGSFKVYHSCHRAGVCLSGRMCRETVERKIRRRERSISGFRSK